MNRSALKPMVAVLALTAGVIALASSCGREEDDDRSGGSAAPVLDPVTGLSADAQAADAVKACRKSAAPAPAPQAFHLLEGVTYSGNLYPVMQRACANCHRGDIENRQNSTNCFYLKENIANVIKRLENAVDAAAYKAANPAATDQDVVNRYPQNERPMPQFGGNRAPLSADEIALFKTWSTQADKCTEGAPPSDVADIKPPAAYSSDEAETAGTSFEKMFDVPACEDGPTVNTPENWALVQPLLAPEANPASAFYDYSAKAYIPNATAAPYECTFAGFVGSLGGIGNIAETLAAYEAYGWKMIQCAVVDGLPRASMATLSRVPNTLGDTILGLNYKTITIDKGAAQ